MPLPQKRWFRMPEVAERWRVTPADIEDYALDELLELSVLVDRLPAEEGTMEPHDQAGYLPVPQDLPLLNGPQPLLRSSLLAVFRTGQAEVHAFRSRLCGGYLRLLRQVPPVPVRRADLIVTREERDRFEAEHGLGPKDEPGASAPWHADDFTRVRVDGEWLSFGPKQAAVLRLLRAAGETDNPWCDGKRLLDEADAATMRLIDLFKRKPGWRRLVVGDGKGRYRLAPELLALERRRIRAFRRLGGRAAGASAQAQAGG